MNFDEVSVDPTQQAASTSESANDDVLKTLVAALPLACTPNDLPSARTLAALPRAELMAKLKCAGVSTQADRYLIADGLAALNCASSRQPSADDVAGAASAAIEKAAERQARAERESGRSLRKPAEDAALTEKRKIVNQVFVTQLMAKLEALVLQQQQQAEAHKAEAEAVLEPCTEVS